MECRNFCWSLHGISDGKNVHQKRHSEMAKKSNNDKRINKLLIIFYCLFLLLSLSSLFHKCNCRFSFYQLPTIVRFALRERSLPELQNAFILSLSLPLFARSLIVCLFLYFICVLLVVCVFIYVVRFLSSYFVYTKYNK